MLKTTLTECTDCENLLDLICQIDDKLKTYTVNQYNNLTLMVCLPFNKEVIDALLHYKRIVTHKAFNCNYACDYSVSTIISRVKILLNK